MKLRQSLFCLCLSILPFSHLLAHPGGHGEVKWPELYELRFRCELTLLMKEEAEEAVLREMVSGTIQNSIKLSDMTMPKKMKRPMVVKIHLDRLGKTAERMNAPADMSFSQLKEAATTLHARVVSVMTAAKQPYAESGIEGPHNGVLTGLFNVAGKRIGWIEVKLHADKGDLEAWLLEINGVDPLDLPVDHTVTVLFPESGDRKVMLAVRDKEQNPDEDGKANIRDGKTNYFIFPGDTGADASWLKGEAFQSKVRAEFKLGDTSISTSSFLLTPHVE